MRAASASIIALALLFGAAQAGAQSGSEESADARWERLQAERAAQAARQREERERYEQGVRDAAAARARYEAEMARHNREVERARAAQADYEQRRADYDAGVPARTDNQPPRRESARDDRRRERDARAENRRCERRARRRGRLIGGLLGGVAGGIVGRATDNPIAGLATALPVALILGEAITRLLDCREQEQAAAATEAVIAQATAPPATPATPAAAQADGGPAQRGVGSTVAWTSETRPGVSGSSTVTAFEQEAGGGECMTVTDIIIVDGQETRAPKRMCRRPPSQRFVRV